MDKTLVGPQEARTSYLNTGRVDALVLALTAPFLLAPDFFPHVVSGIALFALLIPYVARLVTGEHLSQPTAANFPIAILALIFLPIAFVMSPAPWAITWVRITTLAWSIGLYFAVVNWPPPSRAENMRTRIAGPTRFYLGLGALVAVVGLLGMRSVDKLFFLSQTGFVADYLGWEKGLPTNEIAGVLTLFIPFAAALAYGCLLTGRRRQFLILGPLTLLMLATLALSQSRTGITATVIGGALAFAVAGSFSRKWVVVGLVLVVMAALLARLTPLLDWFVYAGANSWDSVIGPRLGIWNQAIDAIRDQPLWGMGLGLFGPLARLVYPLVAPEAGPVLEDAHDLYLQTALDFGLVGLFVFLVAAGIVLVSAARLVRARPPGTLSRLWAAGLLGALVAHALYSLTDAVSLGTLAGVPLWFLFGLVMGASRGRLRMAWTIPARLLFGGAAVLIVVLSVFAMPVNRAGQLAVHTLLTPAADPVATATAISPLANVNCRARWYEGLLRHAAGDMSGREAIWGALLDCSGEYTDYMAVLAADDVALARRAIAVRPESATGYFWLAPAVAAGAPDEAIALYREGLKLTPRDGLRWLALADLLQPVDEPGALEAYLQACRNGDPGANGCLRAGALAEARGDTQAAIEYYRLSKFSGALDKADELERQLAAEQP